VPYTPEQNGLAERTNRTLIEKARCMLFDAKLENELWAEAINTAVYIINYSPSRGLKNQTPEELWTGNKPNLEHLRIFGSKAMVHVPKQKRQKLDPKSIECVMVGYCNATKGYRLFNKTTKDIIISRDIIFLEDQSTDQTKIDKPANFNHFLIDLDPVEISENIENQDSSEEGEVLDSNTDDYSSAQEDSQFAESSDSEDLHTENQIVTPALIPALRRSQRKSLIEMKIFFYLANTETLDNPETVEEALSRCEILEGSNAT